MRAVAPTVLLIAALTTGTAVAAAAQEADETVAPVDRRLVLEDAVATEVGSTGLLPTPGDEVCPTERVEVVWEEIPAEDIDLGGYLSPLIEPDPVTGDRATGIATCDGDPHAVAGFDAEWTEDDDTWRLGVHPVDLTAHEADEALLAVEAETAAKEEPAADESGATSKDATSPDTTSSDTTSSEQGLALNAEATESAAAPEGAEAAASSGGVPVPSWPSTISHDPGPLSSSDPQDQCLSTVQPGARALADLLTTTYPSQDRWSVLRACDVGGRSEHKEGRAVDWMVDAYDPAEKAIGDRVTRWLVEDDPWGNDYGGVRHMGIMYMIWNTQGWYQFWADQGWRDYTGSSPHTDHVHFSLTWPGARCETTWWQATGCDGTWTEPAPPPPPSSSDEVIRVAGGARVETSVKLSREAFDREPTIVLASAATYADALSAGALATALEAPLLLTSPRELPSLVADELRRLRSTRVFIVGGSSAVHYAVGDDLKDLGMKVVRLRGSNRVATSADVARRVANITGGDNVVLARSDDFPDALAATNIAAAGGAPILLTYRTGLSRDTEAALRDIDPSRGWVMGGEQAISEKVRRDARDVFGGRLPRIAGSSRLDTSLLAADKAEQLGMDRAPAFLASAHSFPDALSAGPAAAAAGGQLLLVHPTRVQNNERVLDELASERRAIDMAFVAGGSKAITTSLDPEVLTAISD